MPKFFKRLMCLRSVPRSSSQDKSRVLRIESLEARQLMTVGLSAVSPSAFEGVSTQSGILRVMTSETPTEPIEIALRTSGSAVNGVDYELFLANEPKPVTPTLFHNGVTLRDEYAIQITIPEGASYVDLELRAVADSLMESPENATFTLISASGASIADDAEPVTLSVVDPLLCGDAPSGSVVVSNLSLAAGFAGGWKTPGGVVLSGVVSGSNVAQVEVDWNGATFYADVDVNAAFHVASPSALPFGDLTTLRVRGIQYDAENSSFLAGSWTTLNETPSLPGVASLSRSNDSGNAFLLTGALGSTIGASFTEVEFRSGDVVLGSTLTDADGQFSFVPEGIAAGAVTIAAQAVWRPDEGDAVYGASASITTSYTPASVNAESFETTLLYAGESASSTSTPEFQTTAIFASDAAVAFEYRWKLATAETWSEPVSYRAYANKEGAAEDTLVWTGSFSIDELYDSQTNANVNVQTRALVYDPIVADYVPSGEWTSLNLTYVVPTFSSVNVTSLTLAAPLDSDEASASDPTLSGAVSVAAPGIAVYFYETSGDESVLLGRTTTDATGAFLWTASSLTLGDSTITATASRWNPLEREYEQGASQSLSFEYVAPLIVAPNITSLTLLDDTGTSNDGITANATIVGRLADGEESAYLPVLYDVDGDGIADGWTRADDSGAFYFTPDLETGANTISVRATRWDHYNQNTVYGAWQTLSFSYASGTGAAPGVQTISLANVEIGVSGLLETHAPRFEGRATSEGGFDAIVVRYELSASEDFSDPENVVIHENAVSPFGAFCWSPELTAPETDTTYSARVRVGRVVEDVDPVTGETTSATTWGEWSTTSFLWLAASSSSVVSASDSASPEDPNVRVISGTVAPGSDVVNVWVEFDVDGDGTADGAATVNSRYEFAYSFDPCDTSILIRTVDAFPDGTTRASQNWQSVAVAMPSNDSQTPAVALYFDETTEAPYLHAVNAVSAQIAIDYDLDGEADAYVTPGAGGYVSAATILTALSDENITVAEGFSVVDVWLVVSQGDPNVSAVTYFPLLTSDSADAQLRRDAFAASYSTLADYDPYAAPGTRKKQFVSTYDVQTTSEPGTTDAASYEVWFSAVETLPSVGRFDLDALASMPLPQIAAPILDGETLDLRNDVQLQRLLAQINENESNALSGIENQFKNDVDSALNAYKSVADRIQNEYNETVAACAARVKAIKEQTWFGSAEDLALTLKRQQKEALLNTQQTQRQNIIYSAYNQWFIVNNVPQDGGAFEYFNLHPELKSSFIDMEISRAENTLELEVEIENLKLELIRDYDNKRSAAIRAFEETRADQLAE